MTRRRAVVAVLGVMGTAGVLILPLQSSGASAPGPAPQSAGQAGPFAPVDLAGRIDYGSGLLSDPVSDVSVKFPVSPERVSRAPEHNAALQPGTPTAALRRVTIPYHVQLSVTGVPTSDPVTARLANVYVWANSPDLRGPIRTPEEQKVSRPPVECVFVLFEDAATSEVLDRSQYCRPK